MNRILAIQLPAAAFLTTLTFAAEVQDRPNILWIYSDDHACEAIGAYGGRLADKHLTPRLDRLAAQGMRFDRSYVANSICSPARATILTGKHSHKNGKFTNVDEFDHNQPQVQKHLRSAGYLTALIGKIHIDGEPQGFDHWEVLPGQGSYENPDFLTPTGPTRHEGHSTDVIANRALKWLKEERDPSKPFFAMVQFKAPHRPWIPAERFRKRFEDVTFPEPPTLFDGHSGRGAAAKNAKMGIYSHLNGKVDLKTAGDEERLAQLKATNGDPVKITRLKYQFYMRDYAACVAGLDENIGRILDYLDESGLAENTVVFYSSDQGFYLGEHGWFDKRFMYEESFRTPLIVRWPGKVTPASVNSNLVQNIDMAPTFLELAGTTPPEDMQGASIRPLLEGQTPKDWRTSLYYHFFEFPGVHSVMRHEGVFDGRYKLIRFYNRPAPDQPVEEYWEFYDLQQDPEELWSSYDDEANAGNIARLRKELGILRAKYEVPDNLYPPSSAKGD